jgi:hypothetical protein
MDGLKSIIAQLERQRTAIERALAALREVDGVETPVPVPATQPATRKRASKNRRSEAQKARWAAKRAAVEPEAEGGMNEIGKKGGMTEDGRRRLAEAMKKRWAVKRAASAVKRRAGRPKKAA